MIKKIYRKLQSFFVSANIKNNFRQITQEDKVLLSQEIKNIYIPTISNNLQEEKIFSEIQEHLEDRIYIDRTRVIPWLSKNMNLNNLNILEIGCGTGSSSITLAEQGANVVGVDIHKESLQIAKFRSKIYDLKINFLECSSVDVDKLGNNFEAIILYATLEHLTFEERIITLEKCKKILDKDGLLIVIEAPNRLWYFDSHTSELPFFQWLPDDLAYKYSKFSPKKSFSSNYQDENYSNLVGFLRRGRGVSYHEFELVFDNFSELNIISRLNRLVFTGGYVNTFLMKPFYKLFLKKQVKVPTAFYDEYLDFIIKM